jgi:type II secretory pathway pseudopilin PulG
MNYSFIQKAQTQPDLQEVVKYLQKPMSVLDELFDKYNQIALQSKVKLENMDIYRKCDKIIHQHLPKLIDNYCEFSFQYRNETPIKEEIKQGVIKKYTAKDLLLIDLAKVIEEIYILENDFNETNKFETLVTNRIISNLGQPPEIINQEPHKKIVLANEFELDKYQKPIIKEEVFVKPIIKETILDDSNEDTDTSPGGFSLIEIILVISFMVLAMMITFILYEKVSSQQQSTQTTQALAELNNGIHLFYAADSTRQFSTNNLIESNTIPPNLIYKKQIVIPNVNLPLSLSETTINAKNDSIDVTVNNLSDTLCLKVIAQSEAIYEKITVNKQIIKNNLVANKDQNRQPFDPAVAMNSCHSPNNTITFTTSK